jgi:hypothetical protein
MIVNRKKRILLISLFFMVLSGFWIAPAILNLNDFLFHPNAQYSDVLISHWPNWYFIRDAIHTWREFPLWNPLILSGAPLVGDPLFGIWYPPNWLNAILPIGMAINLLFWVHLAWAGIGMFYWMREEGLHWAGALLAGIAFSGMPKLIGHIGMGHLGLVSSVAWTPWLLLVTRRIALSLSSDGRNSLRWSALGGVVAGILFVADPRWILPSVGLAILYASRTYIQQNPSHRIILSKSIMNLLTGGLIFAGLISGLAIPMIEFTLQSTRMNLSLEEITQISLPINNLIGLIIPQYGAWPETIAFAGLLIIGLALIALLGRARSWIFWLSIALGSLILALGHQTPIYPVLVRIIPGINILRVPARFSFLFFLSLIILAGLGLDLLLRNALSLARQRRIRLGLVGLCSMLLLLCVGALLVNQGAGWEQSKMFVHTIVAAIIIGVLGLYSLRENRTKRTLMALWVITAFLDLFFMNISLLEIRSSEELFEDHKEISTIIDSSLSQERTFSPSYSIPQHIGAVEGLQLADGVNPLQIEVYWEFMAQATGYEHKGYSVTLPPFLDGDPNTPLYQNIDTMDLGLLNVGTIISAYPLSTKNLNELEEIDGTIIYQNDHVRPRAWIESEYENSEDTWRAVDRIDWSPNHISLETCGEGLLVLSEIVYPGWTAYVDGDEVEIVPYENVLRSIPLTQGDHTIEFSYRPLSVKIGTLLTFLAMVASILLWWRK